MVQLIDVTLREVSLATGFAVPVADGVELAEGLAATPVDVVEIGYVRPAEWAGPPTLASCAPDVLARLRAALGSTAMAVFVHPESIRPDALPAVRDAGVDLVRVGVGPASDVDGVRRLADALRGHGLRFALNVIRASKRDPEEAGLLGWLASDVGADVLYLADSNGALFPSQLDQLTRAIRHRSTVPLGLHPHDNLSLAFANAVRALDSGFTWLDGSLLGAGKGGGNLPTERIALYLQHLHGRNYALSSLVELADRWVRPWGVRSGGFWEAVNGTLDLDIGECEQAAALAEDQRCAYYRTAHGLSVSR